MKNTIKAKKKVVHYCGTGMSSGPWLQQAVGRTSG